MKRLIIGVAIMAIATVVAAKMPDHIQSKVDDLKASVQSNVEQKRLGVKTVRAKQGDMVLIHDGVKVRQRRTIAPLEEMSVPDSLTVFIGNEGKVNAEIKRLGLEN